MDTPWVVLAAIVGVAVGYVMLPVVGDVFLRFRSKRRVTCPEAEADAEVGVDARRAAFTAAFRHPVLKIKNCSLWPERSGCEQSCLGLIEGEKVQPEQKAQPLKG